MRNKWKNKSLYIANFLRDEYDDEGNKISIYDVPIFIGNQNIQPLSGTTDIVEYGTKVTKMQKVLLDPIIKIEDEYIEVNEVIKENDLAYLDNVTPDEENFFGENANYRVDSVRVQNKKIAIFFEKLPYK